MGYFDKYFVEVKNGTKVTYSESDLNKLEKMYDVEVADKKKKLISSPFKKEPQRSFQSQVRDYAFEKILDRHLYTFSHMLVIPDPYGVAKQTALILFNSSKKCKVRYRVQGNKPEYDFCGETIYTMRHRVPVMGLYAGRNNKVDMELIDEDGNVIKHRVLTIYVSQVDSMLLSLVSNRDNKVSHFPFIVLNGVKFSPIALDGEGEIRYSLQCKTGRRGMIPLNNGRFLLMDKTANRVDEFGNIHPCRYHEMDYMGRVYRTFLLEYAISRAVTQHGDSLFFVASSDSSHMADRIVEMDMNSGEVIKYRNLTDIIGDKYKIQKNWADVSHMEYSDGDLIITVKKLNSIIRVGWEDGIIRWIVAPSVVWKDTELEKFVLKTEKENMAVCTSPDYTAFINDGSDRLVIFDTQAKSFVPTGFSRRKVSNIKILELDVSNKKYKIIHDIQTMKTLRFGKMILSGDGRYLLAADGFVKDRKPFRRAKYEEIDISTGLSDKNVPVTRIFSNAWEFKPFIEDYCVSMTVNDRVVFGKLRSPEIFEGELPEISKEKHDSYYFGKAELCDDLLLCAMRPGVIDRIYFIGDNNKYVQSYEGMEYIDRKMNFAIPLADFAKDEYYVYVEYQGAVYKLKNEIRIVKKKGK